MRIVARLFRVLWATLAQGYDFNISEVPQTEQISANVVLSTTQDWLHRVDGVAYRSQVGALEEEN